MTIPHLADQQNLVFVPALIALLIATVAICLPIVFAPALRRGRPRGRRGPIVVAGVVAAAALVVAGWQGGVGVGVLQNERSQLQADVRSSYGITLEPGSSNELLNGGSPKQLLPDQATALGLKNPDEPHALKLKATDESDDRYELLLAGKALPITG